MILIEDTRQKQGKHKNIKTYCDSQGIEIYPLTLTVGDYMFGEKVGDKVAPIGNISCDTKYGLVELAQDLSRDERSLDKKYRKCFEQNIKLVVLVEEYVESKKDLAKWQNPHGLVNGRKLLDKMSSASRPRCKHSSVSVSALSFSFLVSCSLISNGCAICGTSLPCSLAHRSR